MEKTVGKSIKKPKQARSKAMVDAILTAATRVLEKAGFDESSTNRIAKVAGVSIGSLYQYFPNKESLISATIQKQILKSQEKIRAGIIATQNDPPEIAIRKLVELVVSVVYERVQRFELIARLVPKLDLMNFLLESRQDTADMIADYFEKRKDELNVKDSRLSMFIAVNAVMGVLQTAMFAGTLKDMDRDRLAEELSNLMTKYLLKAH